MNGPSTTLTPSKDVKPGALGQKPEPRTFTFDYSYWTHDGFQTSPDGKSVPLAGSNYADQVIIAPVLTIS